MSPTEYLCSPIAFPQYEKLSINLSVNQFLHEIILSSVEMIYANLQVAGYDFEKHLKPSTSFGG